MAAGVVAGIGLALTAIGTGVAAYSAKAQGDAADDAAKYNAKVAENDAITARQQADFERNRLRKQHLRVLGRQRAAFAKSGTDLTGSAVDVMYDSALEGEMDELLVLYGGSLAAGNRQAAAQLARAEGRNARTSGYLNAAGTILSGTGRAASCYNRSRNTRPYFGPGYED